MKNSSILFVLILVMSISFWSCQNEQMPVENMNTSNTGLLQKTLESAILKINVDHLSFGVDYDLNVHRVSNEWEETDVTWNDRIAGIPWTKPGGDYDEDPIVHHVVSSTGMLEIDITSLWTNGVPSNGFLLKVANYSLLENGKRIRFNSKESSSPPEVVLTYQVGRKKGVTFLVMGDAEILSESGADLILGNKDVLFAGRSAIGEELRSVIKFDLPEDTLPGEETSCTKTAKYWKDHLKGKKKDPIWDLIGGTDGDGSKTEFFNSGDNYYNIMKKRPWGWGSNPYYLLAHEYIAAELNQLAGAEFDSETELAFKQATELFNDDDITPKKVKKYKKRDEQSKQFYDFAKNLYKFNTGINGPGHCDDYKWKKGKKKWKEWWKGKWGKWKKKP